MNATLHPLTPELRTACETAQAQLLHPDAPFARTALPYADGSVGWRFSQAAPTLAAWLDMGRAFGEAVFIEHWDNASGRLPEQPQCWSYAAFFALADTWAEFLQTDLAVPAGSRVAILAANSPQWVAAFAACVYADVVPAPLNSMNAAPNTLLTLAELAPSCVWIDAARWQLLQRYVQQHPQQAAHLPQCPYIVLGDKGAEVLSAKDAASLPVQGVLPPAARADVGRRHTAAQPEDLALMVYTSGSASRPKAAMFSHDAVCQALMNLEYIGAFAALTSPAALQKVMGSGDGPCLLSCVPYFHVSGLHAQVLSTLKNGRKLALLPRWNAAQALAVIAQSRATSISAAPTMLTQLMALPNFAQDAASLTAMGFGGSAIPPALQAETAKRMAETLAGTGFGMTETGGAGAAASGAVFLHNMTSSGLLAPIMEVRIEDEAGQPLPVGQPGEICLRGPTLMQGYWQQPEASQEALRDGWMHTGDWGYVDHDGYLYIPGRLKEVINRHGEKIAASEVEASLADHPAVKEVAVMPLPDAVTLERVAACVVLHEPVADAAAEQALLLALSTHAASRMAAHKVPKSWLLRSEALPRNAMHKVLKGELLEAHAQDFRELG